jgi:ribosome maturation factor RimP
LARAIRDEIGRQPELDVQGPLGPFFMARHFDRERELHDRLQATVSASLPEIEVIEVELNDPQEKVVVYIDRPDGIAIEHCEAVTRAIRDEVPDHELEVSSPGMERPLRRPSHFHDAIGEKVRIREQGRHRASVVRLLDVDDERGVRIQPDGGDERVVPFEDIVRCKLVVEDPFAAASTRKGRES